MREQGEDTKQIWEGTQGGTGSRTAGNPHQTDVKKGQDMDVRQQMSLQEQACLAYFRAASVWHRLFAGFREKYASYGSFAGTVTLTRLTAGEIETLEGFFGRSYHGQKSASVSAEKFRRALLASRFCEVAPERLLELYFKEPLIGKKELHRQRSLQIEEILERFKAAAEGTPAGAVPEEIAALVKFRQQQGMEEWEKSLFFAAKLYNALPYRERKKEYLAVFAARLTGNPHAFDRGSAEGALLYQLIELDLRQRGETAATAEIFRSYQRQKSYLAAGILIDDVSNYVLVRGIRARKKNADYHAGMDGFRQEREMLQVPLAVLSEWERAECPNERIYIVENPSIFSLLCETAEQDCACMCMNGQPRLAGLLLLDLLAKSGTEIYYAGDLDPEGLLIAQKLKDYYPGVFHFWRMTALDYEKGRSEEPVSEKRLKMLEHIHSPELLPVRERLAEEKKAAYQERIFLA